MTAPLLRRAAPAAALLLAAACSGTAPRRDATPEQGVSAVLVGTRLLLPTGPSREGGVRVNLETDGGREAQIYRLKLRAGERALLALEPGTYRLAPARSWLGLRQERLRADIAGRSYSFPFPRELLRLPAYDLKPGRVLPLGVVEVAVLPTAPGASPEVRARLDDSVAARRELVQEIVRDMMDPRRSAAEQDEAVAWARPLQNALIEVLSEAEKRRTFVPAP